MVKILTPLLKELNISPASKPRRPRRSRRAIEAEKLTQQPKKLGRPKKVDPPTVRQDFTNHDFINGGLQAERWIGNTLYIYSYCTLKHEMKVRLFIDNDAVGSHIKKDVGVWRIKSLKMPSLNQAISYQLKQSN